MPIVKTFVSLMILFVAVNLGMTIYNSIKRYIREGFQTVEATRTPSCLTCAQ